MNYFVLFSIALIVMSVVILVSPLNHRMNVMPIQEGFVQAAANSKSQPNSKTKPKTNSQPTAAGQINLSRTAGMADGSSNNQALLDHLLKKHDRLAEAFENRDADKSASRVSATTTKKRGVASTGADYEGGDNVPIPVAGCNKDKCSLIGGGKGDPMIALQKGNCINPIIKQTGETDYSTKYCPAWEPNDDMTYAEECATCGYYAYSAKCLKREDPMNPKRCTLYDKNYKYKPPMQSGAMPAPDPDDGGGDDGGDDCSTCDYVDHPVGKHKCVIPGCYSSDGGNLPFPPLPGEDDVYNFQRGCFDYNSKSKQNLPGMDGRPDGYYCPPITKGGSYDSGGGSGDPCYTMIDPATKNQKQKSYILDYSNFVKMDNKCSNDKAPSKQEFVPEDVDDNPMDRPQNTKHRSVSKTSATGSTINHQHQHGGSINVYHHKGDKQSGNKQSGNKQSGNKQSDKQGRSNTYQEPVAGATVLGFL
jgi:hypothetical protein